MFSKWLKKDMRVSDSMTREICSQCKFRAVVKKSTTKVRDEKNTEGYLKVQQSNNEVEHKVKDVPIQKTQKDNRLDQRKCDSKINKKSTIRKRPVGSIHRMRTRSAIINRTPTRKASNYGKRNTSNASMNRSRALSTTSKSNRVEARRVASSNKSMASLSKRFVSSRNIPRPRYHRHATRSSSDVSDVTRKIISKCIEDIRQRSRSRSPVTNRSFSRLPIRSRMLTQITPKKAQIQKPTSPISKIKTRSMTARHRITNKPTPRVTQSRSESINRGVSKSLTVSNVKQSLKRKASTKYDTASAKKSNVSIRKSSNSVHKLSRSRRESHLKLNPRKTKSAISPRRSTINTTMRSNKAASKSKSVRRFASVNSVRSQKGNRTNCKTTLCTKKSGLKHRRRNSAKNQAMTRAHNKKIENNKNKVITVDEYEPIHDSLQFSVTHLDQK